MTSAVNDTSAKPALATTTTSGKIQLPVKPIPGGIIKSLYPKLEREFMERALASRFLRTLEDEYVSDDDEEEEKPFNDDDSQEYDDVLKRFLLGSKTTTTTTAKTTTVAISKGEANIYV